MLFLCDRNVQDEGEAYYASPSSWTFLCSRCGVSVAVTGIVRVVFSCPARAPVVVDRWTRVVVGIELVDRRVFLVESFSRQLLSGTRFVLDVIMGSRVGHGRTCWYRSGSNNVDTTTMNIAARCLSWSCPPCCYEATCYRCLTKRLHDVVGKRLTSYVLDKSPRARTGDGRGTQKK